MIMSLTFVINFKRIGNNTRWTRAISIQSLTKLRSVGLNMAYNVCQTLQYSPYCNQLCILWMTLHWTRDLLTSPWFDYLILHICFCSPFDFHFEQYKERIKNEDTSRNMKNKSKIIKLVKVKVIGLVPFLSPVTTDRHILSVRGHLQNTLPSSMHTPPYFLSSCML